MKLTWKLGTVTIATRPPGVPLETYEEIKAAWTAGPEKLATPVPALVSGPFALNTGNDGATWNLTHRDSGGAIARLPGTDGLFALMRMAEELADLDWTGSFDEFGPRNSEAVKAAWSRTWSALSSAAT
jgi:hypothetical protein